MNKNRLILAATLVLTVSLVIAGTTMAYLTSTPATAVNKFEVGTLTTDINENSSATSTSSNTIVIRNNVASKLVQIENRKVDHAIDSYIRVQLVPALHDGSSNIGGDFAMSKPDSNNTIVFKPFTNKDLTVTLVFDSKWREKWNYRAADNCFYYTDIVKVGDKTTPLLTEVRFSGNDAEKWKTKFSLDVLNDSIQSAGKTASGTPAVQEAWPVTVSSSKLTPNT